MPFSRGRKGRLVLYRNILVVMVLVGLWHGANWTFVAWGAYHGLLLIGYRLFDRATAGTAIAKVMKKRWFVPFSVGADVSALRVKHGFLSSEDCFRPADTSLSALFGFHHVAGEFLLTTGTIVLIFISLFLAVAQERSQFIDRLRFATGAYSNPRIRLRISGARALSRQPVQVPFVYFQF